MLSAQCGGGGEGERMPENKKGQIMNAQDGKIKQSASRQMCFELF